MQTTYNKIQALYTALGYELPSKNIALTLDQLGERADLLHSEVRELNSCCHMIEVLGELTDILTLALGTAAMAGFTANQLSMAMDLITEANSKKVLIDGVLTKPEGWQPADLSVCFLLKNKHSEYNIGNLNCSVRLYNCLKQSDINNLIQLSNYKKSEIKHIRNMGVKCMAELKAIMVNNNISFKPE